MLLSKFSDIIKMHKLIQPQPLAFIYLNIVCLDVLEYCLPWCAWILFALMCLNIVCHDVLDYFLSWCAWIFLSSIESLELMRKVEFNSTLRGRFLRSANQMAWWMWDYVMPRNIMEIDLRFLRYSEKIARAYSTIAQNSTLWKSTFRLVTDFYLSTSMQFHTLILFFHSFYQISWHQWPFYWIFNVKIRLGTDKAK